MGNEASTLSPAPAVVVWYRACCAAMALLDLACVGGGIGAIVFRQQIADTEPKDSPTERLVHGLVLSRVGAVLLVVYVASFFLPQSSWAWIYHLVPIAIGLTSCCFVPASIPLLAFWLKPEAQACFGRS